MYTIRKAEKRDVKDIVKRENKCFSTPEAEDSIYSFLKSQTFFIDVIEDDGRDLDAHADVDAVRFRGDPEAVADRFHPFAPAPADRRDAVAAVMRVTAFQMHAEPRGDLRHIGGIRDLRDTELFQ